MADRIHIEGMGLLGSLFALQCERHGIEFTWNDTDEPRVAWRASTGMVYPAGDERSQRGLAVWRRWLHEGWLPEGAAMEVAYWYAHKNPPHDGLYRAGVDLGDMRRAPRSQPGGAVAFDAPVIVRHARKRFAAQRVDRAPDGITLVRAHGFTHRLGAVMWGWTVPVALSVPADVIEHSEGLVPSFYSRLGRFQIVYAYPIPSTRVDGRVQWWWAGSSLVQQKPPGRPLDYAKHFARWREAWARLWPRVPVTAIGEPIQGWRPKPQREPEDHELVLVRTDFQARRRVLVFPPLWHSGGRWAPVVIEQALERLGS